MVVRNELDVLHDIDADLRKIARYDHSVSVPTWGSLFQYDPSTPLGRAQQEVARIYGVPFAYPSTNGTTMLNVLAALTLSHPGDKVLVQRDSHVSILAPLIHADLHPVYLTPSYSERLGVTTGVSSDDFAKILDQVPDVRLAFLTYPNYFGIATDIERCVETATKRKLPIIVDAAHGAHLRFHPRFPKPAETAGATVVTQSTHKTCPALGQGSIVLFNEEGLISRFYEVVNQLGFVSTSFSSVILLALFRSLSFLRDSGEEVFGERIEMSDWARCEINKIDGCQSFGESEIGNASRALDPLRLTVNVSGLGLTGFEAEEILIREFGHYAEMATIENVLFLITLGTSWTNIGDLIESLKGLSKSRRGVTAKSIISWPGLPEMALTPRQAFYSVRRKTVAVADSVGCVSAETISAFPPGSAVIVAGELITSEVVLFLTQILQSGAVLKGASSPDFQTMKIIEC